MTRGRSTRGRMTRGRITPDFAPDPVLYPFQSRWFEGPSGRIHYVDEGPRGAPVIVMCHGDPKVAEAIRSRFA